MSESILPEDHIILRSTQDVARICKEFLTASGIKLYVFNRTYNQDYTSHHNKGFFLSNHSAWVQHFLKHDYMHRISMAGVNAVGEFSGYKILLCSLFEDNLMLKNMKDEFNIDHGILVCKQYPDYCEWYTFAGDKDNPQLLHYYLNHFDELIQFILYFKNKAKDIIKRAEKEDFQLPKPTGKNKLLTHETATKALLQTRTALDIGSKKIIELSTGLIEFSKRESQCLALLQKGYSAKLTADTLHISQRTVEGHLQRIYEKLGCHSKDELIKLLCA